MLGIDGCRVSIEGEYPGIENMEKLKVEMLQSPTKTAFIFIKNIFSSYVKL
jgi:hypothetical protein